MKKRDSLKQVILYFISLCKQQKFTSSILFVSKLLLVWASITSPWYYKELIDILSNQTIAKEQIVTQALNIFIVICFIELAARVLWRFIDFSLIRIQIKNMRRIALQSFETLHHHSSNFFTSSMGWALLAKTHKLIFWFESFTTIFFFFLLDPFLFVLSIVVIMRQQVWYLWAFYAIRSLIYWWLQYYLYQKKVKYDRLATQARTKSNWLLGDTITNFQTIASFWTYQQEFSNFEQQIEETTQKAQKAKILNSIIRWATMILSVSFYVSTVYISILLREKDIITIGIIILLQIYTLRLIWNLNSVGNIVDMIFQTLSQSEEMVDIIQQPYDIQDKKDAQKLIVKKWEIEFKNISFQYPWWQQVFKDFSLTIPAWQKVAFVWHSGSGKSTLVRLLYRFFDIQSGHIFIDQKDISDVFQDSLRQHISLVPQEPILFHRTIWQNIGYVNAANTTQEQIVQAAKKAHCYDFIMQLEKGFDTLVWERGAKLSWWQKQRIAIARAILANRPIVVFDEATAALDSQSEKLIQEAINNAITGKTCLIIAHRLSTIKDVDKIVVLDAWKIVEIWTHQELLNNKNSVYTKMREHQSSHS